MSRRSTTPILVYVILFLLVAGCAQKFTARKPEPEKSTTPKGSTYSTLIAEAGGDPYTNGCVACHKKTAEVDRSLPAYVKRIEGHPEVKEATVSACYGCHEAQKNYPLYVKFYRGIHKVHWTSESFYSKQKGKCFSCHTVETNGVSGIKDYPLAGYRTSITTQKTAPVENKSTSQSGNTTTQNTKPGTEQKPKSSTDTNGQSPSTGKDKTIPQNANGEVEIPTPTP